MSELGMDPQRVLAMASRLDKASTQVRQVGSAVDRIAAEMPALWRGGGGQRFAADWKTHKAALTSAADAVHELAGKARTNAADQIKTSNEYTVSAGPAVGPKWYSAQAGVVQGGGTLGVSIPGIGGASIGVGSGPDWSTGSALGLSVPIPHPDAKIFPGYNYTYQEPIGPVGATGSPEHVISVFENNIHAVFPFGIDPPGPVHDGQIITLHPGPGFVGGTGLVRVNTTPTSVTFTVLNDHYFDPKGSQITFTAVENNGQVYLQQHGNAPSTAAAGYLGTHVGFTKITWDQQASNLRDQLGVPQPFDSSSPYDYYNWVQHHDGGDVSVPYLPTPIPLPIPDKFTPNINIPSVHTPGFNLPVSPIPGVPIPGGPSLHIPSVHLPSIHIPSIDPPNINIHLP